MRDHTRLKVFALADRLAVAVYRDTSGFPIAERFGLQSQMRRAAISTVSNIVEGCARRSEEEYVRFLEISYASARELEYQIDLSARLGYLDPSTVSPLQGVCTETCKALGALLRSLRSAQ
jgi:four helix bundle protein